MIILKSHKTVLSGRAEGERRGHVPKVSATKSTQPDWQRRKANLLVLFYPHCFPKQTVELLKKSAGNYHPAKLFLCFSRWDKPREGNLWTKLDIHKNTNWLTPGSWWALAQGPMGTLYTSSLGVSQGATVMINPWKVTPLTAQWVPVKVHFTSSAQQWVTEGNFPDLEVKVVWQGMHSNGQISYI